MGLAVTTPTEDCIACDTTHTSAALATVTGIVMGLLVGREAPAERAAKLQTILCPAHYPAFQACASELFRKIRVEVRDPFAPPAGHDPMAVCRKVAHQVKAQLPANTGFVLITFDYGDSGQLSYMSTADRADCIALLDEMVERLRHTDCN